MTEEAPAKFGAWRKRWMQVKLTSTRRWVQLLFKISRFRRRHAGAIETAIWMAIIASSLVLVRPLRDALANNLGDAGADAVRNYISGIGLAMVGATAIAASFILFALQVNIERLPHGLFRKFSVDPRLLWSVAASLLLAIGGTALSLVTDDRYLSVTLLGALLCLALILRLLFYAYRRSLRLIDPHEQISVLTFDLARWLQRWDGQVDMMAGLVALPNDASKARSESRIDFQRLTVLQANPHWTNHVKATVRYLVAYAQRAGASGDDDTSALALARLLDVNHRYVAVKGRTFFANNLVGENALVADGIVNVTLEYLKELKQAALSRRDDHQLRQIFSTMASLVRIYASIEYGRSTDTKSHAHLAAGYLKNAVYELLPTGLTDTAMIGVQQLGRAAVVFVTDARANEAVDLIKHIGLIGSAATLKPSERPITLVAVEQLRDLTLELLRVPDNNPSFAFRQLRQVVQSLVQLVLTPPDQSLISGHSFYLSPYYSATSMESLTSQLAQIANALQEDNIDEEVAGYVVRNFAEWSDGLYRSQKDIMLLAAEKRSPFFFDVAYWITTVSEILLTVAAAPAARRHWQDQLRRNANWLVNTLGWLPTNKDTAQFVENWSHLDNLTEFALKARQLDELECYDAAAAIMFNWALQAGAHDTGWGTLARWLTALVGLKATEQSFDGGSALKAKLAAALLKEDAPSQEHRERAADQLLQTADEVRDREFDVDLVRRVLAAGDRESVRQLLRELAAILASPTKP